MEQNIAKQIEELGIEIANVCDGEELEVFNEKLEVLKKAVEDKIQSLNK